MKKEIKLTNVKAILQELRKTVPNLPPEIYILAEYMSKNTNDTLTPAGLINVLKIALYDAKHSKESFLGANINVPQRLIDSSFFLLYSCTKYFPHIVKSVASKDFYEAFDILFNDTFKTDSCDENDDVSALTGEPIIDISKKSKPEIFAALFNAAKTNAANLKYFLPQQLSVEEAAKILEVNTKFYYFMGRILKFDLSGSTLYVLAYDAENGKNLAERIISKCSDIN